MSNFVVIFELLNPVSVNLKKTRENSLTRHSVTRYLLLHRYFYIFFAVYDSEKTSFGKKMFLYGSGLCVNLAMFLRISVT